MRSDSSRKPRQFREKPRSIHTPTPRKEGGRGGHASEPEKPSNTRKEPDNTPDTTPFIPKGALIHTQHTAPTQGKNSSSPAASQNPQAQPSNRTVAEQHPDSAKPTPKNPEQQPQTKNQKTNRGVQPPPPPLKAHIRPTNHKMIEVKPYPT